MGAWLRKAAVLLVIRFVFGLRVYRNWLVVPKSGLVCNCSQASKAKLPCCSVAAANQ